MVSSVGILKALCQSLNKTATCSQWSQNQSVNNPNWQKEKEEKKNSDGDISGCNWVVLTMESKGKWDTECSMMARLTMEWNV